MGESGDEALPLAATGENDPMYISAKADYARRALVTLADEEAWGPH